MHKIHREFWVHKHSVGVVLFSISDKPSLFLASNCRVWRFWGWTYLLIHQENSSPLDIEQGRLGKPQRQNIPISGSKRTMLTKKSFFSEDAFPIPAHIYMAPEWKQSQGKTGLKSNQIISYVWAHDRILSANFQIWRALELKTSVDTCFIQSCFPKLHPPGFSRGSSANKN